MPVHFLDGDPVHQGDPLEILLSGDRWLAGHYEWNNNVARWPGLRVPLGGPWEKQASEGFIPAAVLALNPDATVRRPR